MTSLSASTPVAVGARWIPVVVGGSLAAGLFVAAEPRIAFGLAGAVLAAVALAAAPLLLIMSALLVRPSLDTSGALFSVADVNLAGLMGVGLVAGGGLALLVCARNVPGRHVLYLGSVMLLIALSSLLWSIDAGEGIRSWITYATPIVVFGLVAWSVRRPEGLLRVVDIVLLSAIVPIGMGLQELITDNRVYKQGFAAIEGPFVHPNGFGFFCMVIVVLGLVAFMEARRPGRRTAIAILVLAASVCLFNTYARSAWIALLGALLIIAISHYRQLAVGLGVVALIVGLAIPSVTGAVTERFSDLSSASASYRTNSFQWRTENWERMSKYATDQPLVGHGLGSYLPLSEREFGVYDYLFLEGGTKNVPVYAHNDYLDVAVEIGIPGLLLYIGTFLGLIAIGWQARRVPAVRPYALALIGLTAVLLVIAGVDNVKGYNAILYVLFALGGAVAGAALRRPPGRAAA